MASLNRYDAFVRPVIGGFHAMIRSAANAEPKPVLAKGGKPKHFYHELDALREAMQRILEIVNGKMVREGEIAGQTAKAVDSMFKLEKCERSREISVAYKRKLVKRG